MEAQVPPCCIYENVKIKYVGKFKYAYGFQYFYTKNNNTVTVSKQRNILIKQITLFKNLVLVFYNNYNTVKVSKEILRNNCNNNS